ncbi:MAG: hypothetical protein MET45_21640 [Nostoc sp. LLA-1]|nr:hypothetical protein [Cyanocohniella sp. LLY]
MQILDFLVAVNGIAQLWGANEQFLGILSSNQYDVNSIINPYGIYGGQFGLYSISNQHGMYGGQSGLYSPYNTCCLNPPVIFYQAQPMLIVTRNSYFHTNGLPVVDPDLVIQVYAQLTVKPLQVESDVMTRASQVSAPIISNGQRTVQITGVINQPDGLLQVQILESWVEGVYSNMLQYDIQKLSCENLTGTLVSFHGTVGIDVVAQYPNQEMAFTEGNVYDQLIWQVCGK